MAKAQLHQLSHIPFGFGPRYCIGIEYCYLAIKMAIVSLLRKCSFARAPDTEVKWIHAIIIICSIIVTAM